MRTTFINITIVLSLIFIFCSCQQPPTTDTGIRKNNITYSSDIRATDFPATNTQTGTNSSTVFYSLDKSVKYTYDIDSKFQSDTSSISHVIPHDITVENAKNIASALFGEAILYEYNPNTTLSKEEIQEKILNWTKYLNQSYLKQLLGNNTDEALLRMMTETTLNYLEQYTKKLEAAPSSSNRQLCQWKFFPSSHYTQNKTTSTNPQYENKEIIVTTNIDNIPYKLIISKRDAADYPLANVYAYIFPDYNPFNLDYYQIISELCASTEPNEKQLSKIKNQAAATLENMGIGKWYIDECFYEPLDYGDNEAYIIQVNALPIVNGSSVLRQPQITNLKSSDLYSSNYYYTEASFKFSPDGHLLDCVIMSPIDIIEIKNENPKTMSYEEILEIAKYHFQLYDYHEYSSIVLGSDSEDLYCTVQINNLKHGLARIKVPNSTNSFYYVPAVTFLGNYQVYDDSSGSILFDSNVWWNNKQQSLLVLNLTDGTIINTSQHN